MGHLFKKCRYFYFGLKCTPFVEQRLTNVPWHSVKLRAKRPSCFVCHKVERMGTELRVLSISLDQSLLRNRQLCQRTKDCCSSYCSQYYLILQSPIYFLGHFFEFGVTFFRYLSIETTVLTIHGLQPFCHSLGKFFLGTN
ncbi:unnamed protein product [Ixodes pacificus]